ncbi:MAG: hypothetical protein V4577_07835, partial [Bacteroidota bacterium]
MAFRTFWRLFHSDGFINHDCSKPVLVTQGGALRWQMEPFQGSQIKVNPILLHKPNTLYSRIKTYPNLFKKRL